MNSDPKFKGYRKSELADTNVTEIGTNEKAPAELGPEQDRHGRQELSGPYHSQVIEAPSSQIPIYSKASELSGTPVPVPELSENNKTTNTSTSDATSVSRFRESLEGEPFSAVSKPTAMTSTTSNPNASDNLIDLDELAEDADIAVQELGVVQRKKKTLTTQAKAAGVSLDQLPGRKGEEWKEALIQEEKIHARLQEIERMRRS